ncbi:MAG: glycine cleavage system protein GcvH [Actinomycetota bacterium]|nr:glycine cleavage system protein GcvH [Actinomycetota bacterium]
MTEIPTDRTYSKEHEWALIEGTRVRVGITDFAQEQLGDVVFVGLPEPGAEVEAGKPLGEVESTKSVSDVYSPVSGTVVEKNEAVEANPEKVNADPYGEGWLVIVETPAEPQGMMGADEYRAFIDEG